MTNQERRDLIGLPWERQRAPLLDVVGVILVVVALAVLAVNVLGAR